MTNAGLYPLHRRLFIGPSDRGCVVKPNIHDVEESEKEHAMMRRKRAEDLGAKMGIPPEEIEKGVEDMIRESREAIRASRKDPTTRVLKKLMPED
jgi:hypothetical protein